MLNLKLHTAEKKIQKALRLKTSNELDSVSSSVLYVHSTFFFVYTVLFKPSFLFYMVIIHFCVCLIKWQAGPSG